MELRIGLGHDTHRLSAGRPLVLGNVTIPHDLGAVGHSDADVLLHAIVDALLGAAGLGDIGEWFPNTDPRWSGADSSLFLSHALESIGRRDWSIVNLDCTITAEKPKLTPWKPAIRKRLSELLGIPEDCINVKAKSGEGVGPVGRCEAIEAHAIVLLQRVSSSEWK